MTGGRGARLHGS